MSKKIRIFKGLSVSAGHAKARAFVIVNLKKIPNPPKSEYILVAPYTTPVLNVIIARAKGVICEIGGITSHAAIIARELGIPCIVQADKIVSQIVSGQKIEINKKPGEILIYEN